MTAEVNGLALPSSLLRAVDAGRWPPRPSVEALGAVFPERAEWPEFWTVDEIGGVNQSWATETRAEFVGLRGTEHGLETDRSLLIGQLGPDALVALSFASRDDVDPVVMYLTGDPIGTWVRVADSVDDLLQRLEAGR